MLETKNLLKIYKPKHAVPVKAIDNVSLKFSDTGMIFLLGKSGSGKSTLLNLLGGLDKYDDGEIIIKGVSSKKFSQKHFDSYRNTYVGFIFQEYNVLEDFTVGANIALSLELQNRKATDEEINKILEDVDLAGYGNRKPNELSGGQKQRVAIARALVKNPKIIMADEPTGALDSNTGKQIFDTLKKLSRDKLVIVVSHDRDFANRYADRIIELADGQVISDNTLLNNDLDSDNENGIVFDGNVAHIPKDYHLTEEDRLSINEYIEKLNVGLELNFKKESAEARRFVPTNQEKIKSRDTDEFKLIKSKLSLKNSFIIGSSSLGYKKIRLATTILLSCIAFVLFGLADTFGSYNHIDTCSKSIIDTNITYASLTKAKKEGTSQKFFWNDAGQRFSRNELVKISEDTGVEFTGVWKPEGSLYFGSQIGNSTKLTASEYNIYATSFSAFVEITEDNIKKLGYELLAGKLPDGNKNEIVISEYVCKTFMNAGYYDGVSTIEKDGNTEIKITKINEYSEILGKKINLLNSDFTIVGVIDTHFDFWRYIPLIEPNTTADVSEMAAEQILYKEFEYASSHNHSGMVMVGERFISKKLNNNPKRAETENYYITFESSEHGRVFPNAVMRLSGIQKDQIIWFGEEKENLNDNEIVITSDQLYEFGYSGENFDFSKITSDNFALGIESKDIKKKEHHDDACKIVGIINNSSNPRIFRNTIVLSDSLYDEYYSNSQGEYSNLLGVMPTDKKAIKKLLTYCYDESDDTIYRLNNPVNYELDTMTEILHTISRIFLYIGLGFAAFAVIMLSNFIATSVSHKKHDIGILRAIGSRSIDVFKIFFAESFIIALINFVLSCIGTATLTAVINNAMRTKAGILITVLNFGIRQILILFIISITIAALASFFPVNQIASKKPIDAIRNN